MQRSIAGGLPNTEAKAARTESRRRTTAKRCHTRPSEPFVSVVLLDIPCAPNIAAKTADTNPIASFCVGQACGMPPVRPTRQTMVTTAVLRRWVSAARVTGPQPRVGKVRVHRPSSRTSDDADDRSLDPALARPSIPAARRPVRPLGLLRVVGLCFEDVTGDEVGGIAGDRRDDVRVEVERDANGGVAEPLGDHLRMRPPPSAPTSRRCGEDRGGGSRHVERAPRCGRTRTRTTRVDRPAEFVADHQVDVGTSHAGPAAIRSSR